MKLQFHQDIQGYLLPSLQALLAMKFLVGRKGKLPKNVRAAQRGLYQSYCRGRGVDFDQVRPYQYGDDVRHIHWRAMAKSGHAYTKLFSEERERSIFLVVDYSQSMQFGTRKTFKSIVAAMLAAKFSWEAYLRKDRVGAYIFSEYHHVALNPKGGEMGVLNILRALTNVQFAQNKENEIKKNTLATALSQIRPLIRPGSVILILSDFIQAHEEISQHLSRLALHNQIVHLRIEDPLEKEFPAAGVYQFANQHAQTIQLSLGSGAKNYGFWHKKITEQLESWKKQYGIPFETISTQDTWDEL